MSLYRFYVEGCSDASDKIYISGKDYNHIKNVLRLRPGEEIIISDGTSRDYHCKIADFTEDESVAAEIIDITDNATELPAEITLFQGMPKADKFEHIIQKTVELGVHEIYPVFAKFPESGVVETSHHVLFNELACVKTALYDFYTGFSESPKRPC